MLKVIYWLRWLAVLPGALLAGVLLTFPLHWILYNTLINFIKPYPELPERILSPLVIAVAFVWLGVRIAPARKAEVAVVLFVLWLLVLGSIVAFTLFVGHIGGRRVFMYGGGLSPFMAFVGAVIGFLIARYEAKKSVNVHE